MKSKNNEEKRRSGTLRPSNAKKTIEFNEIEIPIPSDVLTKNAYKIYYETATLLNKAGRLKIADCALLELYAGELATYYKAIDQLEKGEIVITTKSGHPMPSPWIAIKNKALENTLKIGVNFGLTPKSLAQLPEVIQSKRNNDSLIK